MPKTSKKESEKLLNNLKNLLSELELSTQKQEISELVWAISQIAKYTRWSSQNMTEWHKLLERNELIFLSRLKPKTAELKDFKESLYAKIGSAEASNLTPKELERLWDKRYKFFVDETDNVENLRQIIVKRDNHKCRYCGEKFENHTLHLHHVVPKQRYGGANTTYNLVSTCSSCNLRIGQEIEFPSDWKFKGEVDANSGI